MQVLPKSGAHLLAAIIGSATLGAQANADELVVMPYSCSVIAGQPVLRPSQQEGHSVVGRREQRVFRACSPLNPGLCREWTIHRFNFDCGGVAVPWIAAVAGADAHRSGMWIQDGRLRLRMPPAWNMAADDPCAHPPYYGERWRFSRLSRYCADRAANLPPPVVELPAGFAPVFGLDAIFVPSPVAQSSPSSPNQVIASWKDADVSPAKRSDVSPKIVAPKEPPPKANDTADATERSTPTAKGAEPSTPRAGAVVPKIINQQPPAGPSADVRADPMARPELPVSKQADASARVFAEPRINADKTVVTGSTSKLQSPAGLSASSANPFNATWLSITTISIGFGLFVLTVGLAVAFARRREHAELAAMTRHDIASVALDDKDRRGALTVLSPGEGSSASPPSAPRPPSWGQPALVEGGRIPQTREEALQVLGMGIAADAGPAAIKKIVDGLRLSWHPDYAVDQADRDARELRLKQINAAWQILGGVRRN